MQSVENDDGVVGCNWSFTFKTGAIYLTMRSTIEYLYTNSFLSINRFRRIRLIFIGRKRDRRKEECRRKKAF